MSNTNIHGGHSPKKLDFFTSLLFIVLLLFSFIGGNAYAQSTPPLLSTDSEVASAGFFQLKWEGEAEQFELQAAHNLDFYDPVTVYIGPDRATAVSGKSDGVWYYRVRAVAETEVSPWSDPVMVRVEHHSLVRAFLFLLLGVFVFLATLAVIIRGPENASEKGA